MESYFIQTLQSQIRVLFFALLTKCNWKVKVRKCQFCQTKVIYLGDKVYKGSVSPLDRNSEKLKQMKNPINAKEIHLGFCRYYKKFIQVYGYIAHPLRQYTV